MLRLAVATQAETFERMDEPLADRGIEVVGIRPAQRRLSIGSDPFPAVDVGFVFPPRLMEGGVVDATLDVPWVNDRAAVLRSRNKAEVLAHLAEADVPIPATELVSNPVEEEELVAAYERIGAPAIVKPNSTSRGTGVTRVGDLDSFLGVADYLDLVHDYRATGDRSFLVQEFLPDARDVRVMVIDGTAVGAVERRLPPTADADDQWKHNVHRGAEAEGIDLEAELAALAERVADVLSISFLGVDLLVGSDRTVVTETNARPTIDAATKYEPGFWDDLAGLVREAAAEE